MRPRLLDLCCKAGGAAMGYHLAGFDVVGVDKDPQPRFPFEFHQADALEFLTHHGHEFDGIVAGPPCQRYSKTQRIRGNEHPDLIRPIRGAVLELGVPYVIENVEDARGELINPVMLCGAMFPELRTYRHRLFEASFPIAVPAHPEHTFPLRKMGRPPREGEFMHVVGNFSGVEAAKRAMGIDWMVRDEMREAIPPRYAQFIGAQLLEQIERRAAA